MISSSSRPASVLYLAPSVNKTVGLGYISQSTFSQDGKYFSAVFNSTKVKQWSTTDWHETHSLTLTGDSTNAVFSQDGKLVAAESSTHCNIVTLWNIASKHRVYIADVGAEIDEKYKLFFADSNNLVVRTKTGSYLVYYISMVPQDKSESLNQRQNVYSITLHKCTLPHDALIYSPNGDDNKVTIFDERTDQARRVFSISSAVYSAALSLNENHIVIGGRESGAEVWSLHTGKHIYTVNQPRFLMDDSNQYEMLAVTFSSDDNLLATGDQHGSVQLWRASTGEKRAVFQARASTSLTFSPDNKTLVVGNGLGGFQVYDVSSCS